MSFGKMDDIGTGTIHGANHVIGLLAGKEERSITKSITKEISIKEHNTIKTKKEKIH